MTVQERTARLRAMIMEHVDDPSAVEVWIATMVCDRCGAAIHGTLDNLPTLLEGWQLGDWREEADFCPRCAEVVV